MTKLLTTVNALTGAYDGPIAFVCDGQTFDPKSADDLLNAEGSLYVEALQEDDTVPFIWRMLDGCGPEDHTLASLEPTVAVHKDDVLLLYWALDVPARADVFEHLEKAWDAPFSEQVPLPGTKGWELVHLNEEAIYTAEQVLAAYAVSDEDAEPEIEDEDDAAPVAEPAPAVEAVEPAPSIEPEPDVQAEPVTTEEVADADLDGEIDLDALSEALQQDTTLLPVEPAKPVKVKAKAAKPAPEPELAMVEGLPWEPTKFADATALTAFDPNDPALSREIVVTQGANAKSNQWTPVRTTIGTILNYLIKHEVGPKDGKAWVLADMVAGARNKNGVKAMYAAGLDIDTGMSGEVIDAEMVKLGNMGVRYTTHSHMKGETRVKKDLIIAWAMKHRPDQDADPENVELIRAFLCESRNYDPKVAETAELRTFEHVENGIEAVIEHAPMPKHRVIVFLSEPFDIAREGRTQKEALERWRKIPQALARRLGNLPIDSTGSDPNRLFYLPRHAKGAPFEISLFGGPLLDWRELTLETKEDLFEEATRLHHGDIAKSSSRSVTEKGKELGRTGWAAKACAGFGILDVLRDHAPEKIRHDMGAKAEIECPFDDDHSNSGDTDDRACFAVSAGEGTSEVFTVSCRHDGCRDKTNLDMLGKMIEDQWFEEPVIHDESYNAILTQEPTTPEAVERQEKAQKQVEKEVARSEYQELIDGLAKGAGGPKIRAAIAKVIEAGMDKIDENFAIDNVRKNVGLTQANMKQIVASVKKDIAQTGDTKKSDRYDGEGDGARLIFSYQGEIDQHAATEACVKILNKENTKQKRPHFAVLENKPVRLVQTKTGRVRYEEMTPRALWSELNKRLVFMRVVDENQTDTARAFVPKEVGDQVYEIAFESLPQAPEVIYTPIFDSNYKLIHKPGYYEEENILIPKLDFELPHVPDVPTADDIEAAMTLLRKELLIDFPFQDTTTDGVDRREASEANALAMILTPFMRRMINGCTPVFFVAKPQPGTGGTFLGKIPLLLFDGEDCPPMLYTDNPEEMAKSLLAGALNAKSHMFFDDVKSFNNREIMRAVTSTQMGGRVLGGSKNAEIANRFNWIATGNNPLVSSEMERRICWVRLNANMPDIQKRVYHHPDLHEWMMSHRAEIIGALLTLIQNWIVNFKMEPFTERKQASFEDWASKVGGVLRACGFHHAFLDNRRPVEADGDESALRMLIKDWWGKFGETPISANKLFEFADSVGSELIEGQVDDSRTKQKFRRLVGQMENRTFEIDEKFLRVVRTLDRDKNPVLMLRKQERELEVEIAASADED